MLDAPMEWGQRFSMKSSFLASLPEALVRDWADQVSRVPDGAEGGFSVWAWGRAIAGVSEEDTAFTGRDAAFWAGAEIVWNDDALDDACRSWARTAADTAAPYATVGRYVNDVTEVGHDVARMIYGDAKYDRLVALKRDVGSRQRLPAQPEHPTLGGLARRGVRPRRGLWLCCRSFARQAAREQEGQEREERDREHRLFQCVELGVGVVSRDRVRFGWAEAG